MTTIRPIAYAPSTATYGRRTGIVMAVVCALHAGILTALVFRASASPAREPVRVFAAELIAPAAVPVESVSHAVATISRPVKEPLHRPPAASRMRRRLPPAPPIHAQPRPGVSEVTPANAPATEALPLPARMEASKDAPPAGQPIDSPQMTTPVSRLDCAIVRPAYPALSRRLQETGTAVVQLVIDEHGTVESARVASSSGYPRLDDAARQAVRASTCSPFLQDGTAKRVSAAVPFTFSLDN